MSDSDVTEELMASSRSVTDGALFYLVATMLVTAAGFVLTLGLTRLLGATLYGIYAYGFRILGSARMFTNLGTDVATIRYVASAESTDRRGRILGTASLTTIVVSTLVGVCLFVGAPTINRVTLDAEEFTLVLQVFAVAVPFESLTRLVESSFRGVERPGEQAVVRVIGPALRLLAIGAALLAGYSIVGVAAAFAAAAALTFVFALGALVTRTDLRPRGVLAGDETSSFFGFSLPLTLSRTGSLLYTRVDVFMVGFLLSSREVGVYSVALVLAALVSIPLTGFNQLFQPVVSRLHDDGDHDTLSTIFGIVTRWSITASLVVALPLVLYRDALLALFGEAFPAGALVLVLFVVGQLVNASAGPSNDLLTMTGHQYVVLVNHWVFGLINVGLNYVFITSFGMVGAALATAAVLAVVNVVRVLEVWYLERLFPYTRRLWKPLAAGVGAGAVMAAWALALSGLELVVVGGLTGGVTYLALLYGFGLERTDRRLLDSYLGLLEGRLRYRSPSSEDDPR